MVGAADAPGLVADPGIDIVVIASPNGSHFPLAEAALESGKHIVIDKPFTVTSREADALIALAHQRQRMLTVFHNRRWDGDFLTVRSLLRSGRLGEVMLYESYWDRFRPTLTNGWRELPGNGAGLLWDLGPHLIDQALILFGRPDAISADVAVQRPQGTVDDYFVLTLSYGARRAVLSASKSIAQRRPRFALHGSEASFVKYGLGPQEPAMKEGASPLDPGFGEEQSRFYGHWVQGDGAPEIVPTANGRYLTF